MNLLDDLKTDHTIIVITHNKDLMKKSDKLIVLKNGRIDSIGKHNELILYSKAYKNLQI